MKAEASIIIPLLKQVDAWLEQAVRSALEQTAPSEVIVVTSPRTLSSNLRVVEKLREEYPCLRVMEREPQMRFAAALNLGIRAAGTERFGLLMTDDWLDRRAVERCLEKDADIVSTGRTFLSEDGVTVLDEIARAHSQEIYKSLKTHADRANFLGHFLLIRREKALAVGGVDETVGDSPGVDDFDLLWKMLDHGASAEVLEEKLYNYRDHSGERLTTRRRDDMVATFGQILDKHGVKGAERELLMKEHSVWFGKSMWSVYQEAAVPSIPTALKPLRSVYRAMLPMGVRLALHERLIRPIVGRKV